MKVVFVILVILMPIPLYIGFMSLFKNRHRLEDHHGSVYLK